MAHAVGQFHGQRLLGGLGLIIVEGLFVRGVVGSGFVRGLGDDKGIAGGVNGVCFVAGRDASRVGLGRVVAKAGRCQADEDSGSEKEDGNR